MAQAQHSKRFQPGSRPGRKLLLKEGAILQGRYKVERILSVQGGGQVYRATDLRFPGNQWALKVFGPAQGTGPEGTTPVGEFSSVMRTLISFHHPNLIKTVDFFQGQGFSCAVMELIHGRSLEQILEESTGPLPERQVLSWGVQCADALLYLQSHAQGFTHYRNLSPRKILISAIGELKLVPSIPDSLEASNIPGIMGYAPPEAFDEKSSLDERSDIYTLAAILHRALSGGNPTAIPFVFIPLDPVNPNLDSAIERILEKATQANPAKRYSNLSDFRREIYRCLQAVLQIQFNLSRHQTFSDAFWWTLMAVSGSALAAWFYLYYTLAK